MSPPTAPPDDGRAALKKWLAGRVSLAQAQGFKPEELAGIAHLATVLYEQGKTDSARVLFEGLEALTPDDPRVHSALGAVYLRDGREGDALRHLNRALELSPSDTHALCNRGELRLRAGMLAEATADLRRAISLDPRGQDPAAMRARALIAALKELGDRPAPKALPGKAKP